MAKWGEIKARWGWLRDNLPDDEPVVFKLPRREARKRVKNTENRKRIVFSADPTTYSAFHQHKEIVMRELEENPTMFGVFITDLLKGFAERPELIAHWRRLHEESGNADINPSNAA